MYHWIFVTTFSISLWQGTWVIVIGSISNIHSHEMTIGRRTRVHRVVEEQAREALYNTKC